jgi:hypothetical protein
MDIRKFNDSELIDSYKKLLSRGINTQTCWFGKNLMEQEIKKRGLVIYL